MYTILLVGDEMENGKMVGIFDTIEIDQSLIDSIMEFNQKSFQNFSSFNYNLQLLKQKINGQLLEYMQKHNLFLYYTLMEDWDDSIIHSIDMPFGISFRLNFSDQETGWELAKKIPSFCSHKDGVSLHLVCLQNQSGKTPEQMKEEFLKGF